MTGKDVDMADAGKPAAAAADAKPAEAEAPKEVDPLTQLKRNVVLLERGVSTKETRFTARALRQTTSGRKKLDAATVAEFIKSTVHDAAPLKTQLLACLATGMDVDTASAGPSEEGAPVHAKNALPEIEIYAALVVLVYLVDQKRYDQTKTIATATVQRLAAFNRRSMDLVAARIYFYLSLAHERTGTLSDVRSSLLALHRTASLRRDEVGEEMLINLLLRNYLHYNQYDQAEKLRSKMTWPEKYSNQQYCRYLFYLGTIRAIQLEYSAAKDCLTQASRKAPKAARGFRIELYKWLVLVRLLLGEIPERVLFRQPGLQAALEPYFDLTQAVRKGDLHTFHAVAERYSAVFAKDKTSNLIVRLRRNVIRTGLRHINLAYSRISLADVAAKLGLASAEDAECIVSKAIRDGGIDAVLDHTSGWMQSRESVDVYTTAQPQAEFHTRVTFCLDLHNEAVKAMRFPADAHKKALETAEARRERQVQELEYAMAEDEDEDF